MADTGETAKPRRFDALRLWPSPEDKAAFHSALAAAYGDKYEHTEGERLLLVAAERFREADEWTEWSDNDLWRLLVEATNWITWLQQLLEGRSPSGWPLPPSAAKKPHIRDKGRRAAMGLDVGGYRPTRANPRLRTLMEKAGIQGDGLDQHLAVLGHLGEAVENALAAVEPARGKSSRKQIERLRQTMIAAGYRPQEIDESLLESGAEPIKAGRRVAAPALVALVDELASSWARAKGRPPPIVRPPSTSKTAAEFLGLLRALEKAHRRDPHEIGNAAVRKGITASKTGEPAKGG